MTEGLEAMNCAQPSADSARVTLDMLLQQAGIGYAAAARLLGRNPAYVQQFIRRGVPRHLPERDRRLLAQHLGVNEAFLGAPDLGPPQPNAAGHAPALDKPGATPVTDSPFAIAGPLVRIPWLGGIGVSPRAPLTIDRAAALRLSGGRPAALAAHAAAGDAMAPTIADGDQLLIDRDGATPPRDGIHLLRVGQHHVVRRIALLPATGQLAIRCDNPAYGAEERADASSLALVGRVVWIGRFLA